MNGILKCSVVFGMFLITNLPIVSSLPMETYSGSMVQLPQNHKWRFGDYMSNKMKDTEDVEDTLNNEVPMPQSSRNIQQSSQDPKTEEYNTICGKVNCDNEKEEVQMISKDYYVYKVSQKKRSSVPMKKNIFAYSGRLQNSKNHYSSNHGFPDIRGIRKAGRCEDRPEVKLGKSEVITEGEPLPVIDYNTIKKSEQCMADKICVDDDNTMRDHFWHCKNKIMWKKYRDEYNGIHVERDFFYFQNCECEQMHINQLVDIVLD